jgi:Ca2+-binding EF-hand superfamily protein
LQSF